MAITAEVWLIFSTSANGSRKNSSSQAKGTPNTTRRWNTTARTRSAKGVARSFFVMASVPEQDRTGSFPGHEHLITPGGPLAPALHVGHGGLNPLTTGQLHVVRRDVTQVGDVVYCAAAPVGVALGLLGGQVDLLRAQGDQGFRGFRRRGYTPVNKHRCVQQVAGQRDAVGVVFQDVRLEDIH